jgi:hypothetical protein
MSELALFKGGLPAYLKNVTLDADTKAVAGGGGGNKRISIKGNVFRMIVDGEEIAVNEDRSMNVVVVRMAHKTSRTFYMGKYKEGEVVAPTCWSPDSEKPDASVEEPQSSNCADCPQNIKGSGEGESRACRYQHRVALALAGDLGGDIYQMVLPATSYFGKGEQNKWPFKQYVQYLANHNVPVGAVVTEMKFDTKSPVPKLTFRPVEALEQEDYETVRELGERPAAQAAIKMTPPPADSKKKAPAQLFAKKSSEPAEEVDEPVRRASKPKAEEPAASGDRDSKMKAALSKWADDDGDE